MAETVEFRLALRNLPEFVDLCNQALQEMGYSSAKVYSYRHTALSTELLCFSLSEQEATIYNLKHGASSDLLEKMKELALKR
jgi:hypothetical protein